MKYQNSSKVYRIANITDSSSFLLHMLDPSENSPVQSRSSSPSFHIDKTISYGGVCCLLKILQGLVVVICLYFLAVLVRPFFLSEYVTVTKNGQPFNASFLSIPHIDENLLPNPGPNLLLDLDSYETKKDADPNLCSVENLLFLVIVHSKVDNFHLRKTIRETWGSISTISTGSETPNWKTRVVFILGQSNSSHVHVDLINDRVDREAKRYRDIVLGSFPDLYKNLRYKHILGLRWASEHCSNAAFFIKADDDAFIDLPGLQAYLQRTLGPLKNTYTHFIGGNVFPEGTKPMRSGKWKVSREEYPWEEYPPFLGGLAYVMSPDVARKLFRAAYLKEIPQIWVDDVWVTGILRSILRIHPLFLNAHYNYNQDEILRWLSTASPSLPPPSNFVHLDPSTPKWEKAVSGLWKHVVLAYNISQTTSKFDMVKYNDLEPSEVFR